MISLCALKNVKRLLCIGAHSDDIEIGAGATVLRIIREAPDVEVTWCVLSGNAARLREARRGAKHFLKDCATKSLILTGFPDTLFPDHKGQIKQFFEQRLRPANPDLILTHSRLDRHQDHRVVSEVTWNTFRSHQIWEYEIPKWDGDLLQTNLYVPAEASDVSVKIAALLDAFRSQSNKHWFDEETFRGLMRIRGLESNTRYAEAFTAHKLVLT
jgi:LmbE family N-acetylglucosaminyl deacetylase